MVLLEVLAKSSNVQRMSNCTDLIALYIFSLANERNQRRVFMSIPHQN